MACRGFFHGVIAAVFAAAAFSGCGGDDTAPTTEHPGDAGHKDAGPGHDDAGPGDGGAGAGSFVSTDCADVLLEGASAKSAECGWVTVPEDHGKHSGETIELAVAVLKATGANAVDDPIVVLAGGPGLEGIESTVNDLGAEVLPLWRETRDIILFDQRGTGVSKPKLDCPEYGDQFVANWAEALSRTDELDKLVAAMKTCHDRLVGDGVHLELYTSAQSARDVKDIVRALGYTSYNLYGVSYGTRLALTVVRDVPEGVRSVVLDSPESLEADIVFAKDVEYAFKQLFAACDADPKCAATYPNLEQSLLDTVSELDANPVSIGVSAGADAGLPPELVMTGTRYLLSLQGAMYATSAIHWVPGMIADMAQGNTGVLPIFGSGYVNALAIADIAEGMGQSVTCSEEFPFDGGAPPGANAGGANAPYARVDQFDYEMKDVCDFWDTATPDPKENEAVHSDLPTLILTGSLDPVLPHYYAEQVASDLTKSQYLLFEGFGHGIVRSKTGEASAPRCAQRISRAFFDAPTHPVDSSCQQDIPPTAWAGAM